MFVQKFLISILIAGCCAIPASASMTTYCASGCSNPGSAFAAATVDDAFQNISVPQGVLYTSFTDLGVDFAFPDITGVASPSPWPTGTAIEITGYYPQNTIIISSLGGADSIDFYVGTNVYVSVTDSTGGTYSDSLPLTDGFFGVTTTSTLTSITISNDGSGSQATVGDISIGSADASPTPEAATLLLVGTGLFMMGYLRRRMPRRVALQAASRGTVSTMSTGITPA